LRFFLTRFIVASKKAHKVVESSDESDSDEDDETDNDEDGEMDNDKDDAGTDNEETNEAEDEPSSKVRGSLFSVLSCLILRIKGNGFQNSKPSGHRLA
jgi:hypothetical protein